MDENIAKNVIFLSQSLKNSFQSQNIAGRLPE